MPERRIDNREANLIERIKLARQLEKFDCPRGEQGCFACRPMEKIINNQGEFVAVGGYGRDIYILPQKEKKDNKNEEENFSIL